jgi:hypothetical protein
MGVRCRPETSSQEPDPEQRAPEDRAEDRGHPDEPEDVGIGQEPGRAERAAHDPKRRNDPEDTQYQRDRLGPQADAAQPDDPQTQGEDAAAQFAFRYDRRTAGASQKNAGCSPS